MDQAISLKDLKSESDVEQKIIYPLLTTPHPHGLGMRPENVVTKRNIRKFDIGKGTDLKSYFPDYIIVGEGYPLCVIEAKEPGADLIAAYREARLYANELNAIFQRDVNPVTVVIAVNAEQVWAGHPNSAEPDIKIKTIDLEPHSRGLADLQDLLSQTALQQKLAAIKLKTKSKRKYRPKSMLGGPSIADEAMSRNSFGATLADNLRFIFQPESRADRAKVVTKAYVQSGSRNRYLKPIDKLIRASVPHSHTSARLIEDTTKPKVFIDTLGRGRELEKQVMLVVGSVGSGKSTFIDYVQEVALDADLRSKTLWVHLNMNLAPGSPTEIYDWLRHEIISSIQSQHPDLDFEELETLTSLYSVEVNAFRKGKGKLYSDPAEYNRMLAEDLGKQQADLHKTTMCYCRFCGGEKGKLVIIVLDNCDKRTRDEQLLMFQAAQWIKAEFRSLVILPLREETYDHHRDEPPLDTALKDLVFRVEPPDFHEVLVKRVQMALDEISSSAPKNLRYELPNSMHVDYASSDQGRYLASIVASIFVNDRTVSRLLLGLAGRNIRRAFELFLEICNSGHIPESEIFSIKSSKGNHKIPLHVIMRVLLRRNKRFFSNKESYIKNIVQSELHPDAAMGFSRILLLAWLNERISKSGPTKLDGYFRVTDLLADLSRVGIEEDVALRELEFLVNAHCILTEDFRLAIARETLVKISPAGVVHLNLLTDANYWAALAEDSSFEVESVARSIAERLADAEKQFSLVATVANASVCIDYFRSRSEKLAQHISYLANGAEITLPGFKDAIASLENLAEETGLAPWLRAAEELKVGSEHVVTLARKQPYGFFIDFSDKVSGLLLTKDVPLPIRGQLTTGMQIRVNIKSVEPMTRKIHLGFTSPVE
ncbi:hypothetical protein B5P46_05705 [Rhizobium leguminosarum]|uniref:S1 motif domain-containing protein n=1 Tax=Rhizobium leguminosarum TaxID=384 RepID=A0A4Q1UA43_RHILE|nr:RNA-binding protein [Rhizobium leguminosarum]RXT28291.1 hypothetical protein B5P46_05705 [Rhizobium leguminosarum]